MVWRRVCWRSGASRVPTNSDKRCPNRARSACGEKSFIRAAANSRAKGKPSRCTQTSAMGLALSVVIWKAGMTAWTRCRKSATAAYCASASHVGREVRSGSARGGTRNSCSPRRCSTLRLVTRILRAGHAASRSLSNGAASMICSKLSSSSSKDLWCRNVFNSSICD